MGLRPSLPPTELARQDSALFVEVKCLFSTTPEAEIFSKSSWIETEMNGGQWGDRTHPVSDSCCLARGLGFSTGASGHSRDQRIQSGARGTANVKG
jgi:hypothetical protein